MEKIQQYEMSVDYRIYKDANEMLLFYETILNRTDELMLSNSDKAVLGQPVDYGGVFPEPTNQCC